LSKMAVRVVSTRQRKLAPAEAVSDAMEGKLHEAAESIKLARGASG